MGNCCVMISAQATKLLPINRKRTGNYGQSRRVEKIFTKSPFVFTSERGAAFTTAGFARIIERAGIANLSFRCHICSGTLRFRGS
jgi:hypothetical protein